jgi:hypothetical protein
MTGESKSMAVKISTLNFSFKKLITLEESNPLYSRAIRGMV